MYDARGHIIYRRAYTDGIPEDIDFWFLVGGKRRIFSFVKSRNLAEPIGFYIFN